MINLVQISDLHFGPLFANDEGAYFKGLHPHDVQLCQALMQFLDEDIFTIEGVTEEAPPYLIVTGDLTCTGSNREFEVANTYLFSRHAIMDRNKTRYVGLNQDLTQFASLPGNHDHWSGSWVWPKQTGFSRKIYDQFFEPLPFTVEAYSNQGIELVIFGVDSCSIFEDATFNINPFATGGFAKSHRWLFHRLMVDRLKKPIASGCSHRAAVILCHHPFTKDGAAGPLRTRHANWLGRVAARYGIRHILTGHTHRTWTNLMNINTRYGLREVREVRCPTTLQYPPKLDTSLRKPGLWLHQIAIDQNNIDWKGRLVLFSESNFQVMTEPGMNTHRPPIFQETIPNLI